MSETFAEIPSGLDPSFRDISTFTHVELIGRVIHQARDLQKTSIIPGESLNDSAELAEYHARIQRVQTFDELQPTSVIQDILDGAERHYTRRGAVKSNYASLDELVSQRGQSIVHLDRLNDLKVPRPSQVLFLRAVLIATASREQSAQQGGLAFSERQRKIQQRALFSLRHLATNRVALPANGDELTHQQ